MESKRRSIKNILEIITNTSEESLQSVMYLVTALNDIHSYDMFVKYVNHMKQAINDVKDSFQYINELAKQCMCYECESGCGCDGNVNEFTSKSLGLRYNYDAYINKMFSQNENGNLKSCNLPPCSLNNNDKVYSNVNNEMMIQPLNKSKDDKRNLSEYLPINNNSNNDIYNIKQTVSNPKKQKVSKVTDIIIKINSDQELYDLLSQLFGDNIIEKLTSTNIDNIFIENIEKTIQEIERLRLNDNNNIEQQQNQNQNQNQQLQIKQPLRSKLLQIEESNNLFYESPNYPKPTYKNDETTNTFTYSDELLSRTGLLPKQHHSSYNQEQLTKYHSNTKPNNPKHQRTSSKHSINKDKQNNSNNNNNNTKYPHPKLFINYTSQYGNYFDTPLQHGGLSKIPSYIKHKNQTQT
jgi:hypothetical protein